MFSAFSTSRQGQRKKHVRELKHGNVSSNGTISFDLGEIKSSFSRADQSSAKRFLKRELKKG
ncbi:hypothetical protein [Halomonas koreensis]|uniref:Uncharacterized protein n=1 Tax=Halomonas koreensis TaxID=245385 RepID=A0ABU1FX73_9GAMM|nr:hypothetical protein [Halomonas koreensis]MDR5865285.1 hypothetical protein [Halomonas koreensis]